jgi:hypothetical protein
MPSSQSNYGDSNSQEHEEEEAKLGLIENRD